MTLNIRRVNKYDPEKIFFGVKYYESQFLLIRVRKYNKKSLINCYLVSTVNNYIFNK